MKTLIAYYSRAGATKKAAEGLQKITNGELFEIRGEKNYGEFFHSTRSFQKKIRGRRL